MAKEQIERKIQQVLNHATQNEGEFNPVIITLSSGNKFNGFRIVQNYEDLLVGLSDKQRGNSAQDNEYFEATVIRKEYIRHIECPMLDE